MNHDRVRQLNRCKSSRIGPVVYWMSRDQRVKDNWALVYAQRRALQGKVPLLVLFCFVPDFFEGSYRQYEFMFRGLQQVSRDLKVKRVPFFFISGKPASEIPAFLENIQASMLVTDFSPLRTKQRWQSEVLKRIAIPFFEVDTHNIVPCWIASHRQEKSIHVFRKKIRTYLPIFLDKFTAVRKHPFYFHGAVPKIHWRKILEMLPIDRSIGEVKWIVSGEKMAWVTFRHFLRKKIEEYRKGKFADITEDVWRWYLLPYLSFGQLSVQRVAWEIMNADIDPQFKAHVLDTLITKRELADNFCFYNRHYDSVKGFPEWARKTLHLHRKDPRAYTYSLKVLEKAKTHDEFWNMIQRDLIINGRIFGWAKQYWTKKILEWTSSPEEALLAALKLTEKYGLAGWDTGVYMNIAYSMGGLYDTPNRKEHPVMGKVRRMEDQKKKLKIIASEYAGKGGIFSQKIKP